MCPFHRKTFIVRPVLVVRPSSVTDNLRGGIIPSWAMKCNCTMLDETGLKKVFETSLTPSHIMSNFHYIDKKLIINYFLIKKIREIFLIQ